LTNLLRLRHTVYAVWASKKRRLKTRPGGQRFWTTHLDALCVGYNYESTFDSPSTLIRHDSTAILCRTAFDSSRIVAVTTALACLPIS